MKGDYKVVVARYNEDISWLAPIQESCIIYNKGTPLNLPNEILRPNVGRESETYLHYIIENYDDLPNIVVFTQGNIADHLGANDTGYLLKMVLEAMEHGKSKPRLIQNIDSNDVSRIHWGPAWNFRPDEKGSFYLYDCYKNNHHILFYDWFLQNIQPVYPDPLHVYMNAIFAVKGELLRQRPREYYQKLMEEVNYHVNPVEGHFMERSWYYIGDSITL